MRVLVALGGNALLQRGQALSAENQRANIRTAVEQIARIAAGNELAIAHGNGPQVGLLALQTAADKSLPSYPLDVLGAETEGMIGYVIEQELGNLLPYEVPMATVLTQVEVDLADPAFQNPTKPIGPQYSEEEAEQLAAEKGWSLAPDGDYFRRVVASPKPQRIFEVRPIRWLLERGTVVVCAGGGGIPTAYEEQPGRGPKLRGVEAVVDKDLCSALLADELQCDMLIIATDVDAVYLDWSTDQQRAVRKAHPDALRQESFAQGSMGPKVEAACLFASQTGKPAVIGALKDIEAMLKGEGGTQILTSAEGIHCSSPSTSGGAADI